MAGVSATTADQDALWRKRWMLLASMLLVLAALALLVSMHHSRWSWPLFFWGIAVCLVALVIMAALMRMVSRRQELTDHLRLRLRRRLIIYSSCWIAGGLICGSASAAFDQPWIDIAVSAYVAVILGAGVLVVLRRRNSLG